MFTRSHAEELLQAPKTLPPEKIAEVGDVVAFLRERYGRDEGVEESKAWSDQALRVVSDAV